MTTLVLVPQFVRYGECRSETDVFVYAAAPFRLAHATHRGQTWKKERICSLEHSSTQRFCQTRGQPLQTSYILRVSLFCLTKMQGRFCQAKIKERHSKSVLLDPPSVPHGSSLYVQISSLKRHEMKQRKSMTFYFSTTCRKQIIGFSDPKGSKGFGLFYFPHSTQASRDTNPPTMQWVDLCYDHCYFLL